MAITYDKIATTTLNANTSDVTFSSITGSYTDLVLIVNTECTIFDQSVRIQYNGDTGTNYSYVNGFAYSAGTLSQAANNVGHTRIAATTATNVPNIWIANFMDYSNTTTNKTHISRGNGMGDQSSTEVFCGTWRNTAAITSIKIYLSSGNFKSGGVFTLYGIIKN